MDNICVGVARVHFHNLTTKFSNFISSNFRYALSNMNHKLRGNYYDEHFE